MKNLVKEVEDITKEIQKVSNYLTIFDAMQIAVQIQRNRILSYAYVVNGKDTPSALESIAMNLGATKNVDTTLQDALFSIADAIEKNKNNQHPKKN